MIGVCGDGQVSARRLLLLGTSLFGGLGDLSGSGVLGLDGLDHTDGHGLTHVTHGETTQWREVGESLDRQRLRRGQVDDGGITRLDEFRIVCVEREN